MILQENDFLSFDMSALIIVFALIFVSYLALYLYLKHRKETALSFIMSFIGVILSMYSITINLPLTPMLQILFFFLNFSIFLLTIGRGFDKK